MVSIRLLPLGLAVATVTTVAACASGGGPAQLFAPYFDGQVAPHRTEVPTSVDRVSALVPGAYELMGLPVSLDEELGEVTFVTPEMELAGALYQGEPNSDYIDCGMADQGPRADVFPVRFAVLTRVMPGPAGCSMVETVLCGFAKDPAGEVACRGTGKLEGDISRVLLRRAP